MGFAATSVPGCDRFSLLWWPLRSVGKKSSVYEALCLLYVALTRAKQGLYVFLPRESKSRGKAAADWSSMANVVRQSVGDYQSAPSEWPKCVEPRDRKKLPKLPALGDAVPLRERDDAIKVEVIRHRLSRGNGCCGRS